MNRSVKLLVGFAASLIVSCEGARAPEPDEVGQVESALVVCPAGPTVDGIDVSEWQGVVDWDAVVTGNTKFAIARINDGYHMDPQFGRNWAEIKAHGLIRGAYQYFEPTVDIAFQAQTVIDAVGRLGPGDLPVTLDVEWASGSPQFWQIDDWSHRVEAGTGKKPMIYTAIGYWNQYFNGEFGDHTLWVANYGVNCPNVPSSWSNWTFWQWGGGPVPGIGGNVDGNVFNGTLEELKAFAGNPRAYNPIQIFRPSTGEWWRWNLFAQPTVLQWGSASDIPVSGDYDADGNPDFTIWHPASGEWKKWQLFAAPVVLPWGLPGDIPVATDVEGDGRQDFTIWRPSTGEWHKWNLFAAPTVLPWGSPGDVPVPADYNGDKHTEFMVWRPSTGEWLQWNLFAAPTSTQWGIPGDIPVPGDYDGDGKAEIAVWRRSTGVWWIFGQGQVLWGTQEDIPVPGDYNRDGKTDIAVWRPSDGTWYLKDIGNVQFGAAGDIPAGLTLDRIDLGRLGLVKLGPVVTCPGNITAPATSAQGATVTFAGTATDVLVAPTVTWSKASGSAFPIGVTKVTLTATDPWDFTASCTFDVTVAEAAAPDITCPADMTVSTTDATGMPVTFVPATSMDPSAAIAYSPADGSMLPLGITSVVATATNAALKTASCTFHVNVVFTGAPTLHCPADLTTTADRVDGATVTYPAATAESDDGATVSFGYSQPSGSTFAIGSTTVTVTATTDAGGSASCQFVVQVRAPAAVGGTKDGGSDHDKDPQVATSGCSATGTSAASLALLVLAVASRRRRGR